MNAVISDDQLLHSPRDGLLMTCNSDVSGSLAAPPRRCWTLRIVGCIWALLVFSGVVALMRYELTPAEAAPIVSAVWPVTPATLAPALGRATLVMTVHPLCPCSRASVAELDRLLHRVGTDRLVAYVIFAAPSDLPADPEATALWASVAAIRGATPINDVGGMLARHFNAGTSGQTFVFDADGTLRFSGGITAARGRVGDNAGTEVIAAIVMNRNGSTGTVQTTPVFGCSLR